MFDVPKLEVFHVTSNAREPLEVQVFHVTCKAISQLAVLQFPSALIGCRRDFECCSCSQALLLVLDTCLL